MTSTPEQENAEPLVESDESALVEPDENQPAESDESAAKSDEHQLAEPDERLIAAHDQARAALLEITSEWTVGAPAGYTLEEGGVVSLRFENRLAGYPGWFWTVSVARVDGEDPTVLEVELLPGDGALLAPEWVPWAVRLADYQAAQLAHAGTDDAAEGIEDDEDDLDDIDDLDAADFDNDGSPILHAGDVDGVDIDEFAEQSDAGDFEDAVPEAPEFDDDDEDEDEDEADRSY